MHRSEEEFSGARPIRWYDRDPAFKNAMAQLHVASDQHQAQVALNIIKIIVEHKMENETDLKMEGLNDALLSPASLEELSQKRRWYDVHKTLSSAIQLLQDCPADLQQRLIPSIVQVIERTLEHSNPHAG
jgi:hypothetical protein